jgi:hypothetical protein
MAGPRHGVDTEAMKMRPIPKTAKLPAPAGKWHAVSITPGEAACAAVASLRGVRFLAADAPRLPMSACSLPTRCRCVYRHHADRRAALRRIADRGMYGRGVPVERRKRVDRRAVD